MLGDESNPINSDDGIVKLLLLTSKLKLSICVGIVELCTGVTEKLSYLQTGAKWRMDVYTGEKLHYRCDKMLRWKMDLR